MEGLLARGAFVALAYRLGRDGATGSLVIHENTAAGHRGETTSATHQLFLRRGYLTAAQLDGHSAQLFSILRDNGAIDDAELAASLAEVAAGHGPGGRVLRARGAISEQDLDCALRRQAELRLDRLVAAAGSYRFDPNAAAPSAQKSARPFALAAWARRRVETRFDSAHALALATELAQGHLVLRRDLAPEDGDDTDRRILDALATPRSLADIAAAARAPRLRLLSFIAFLRAVGALEVEPVRPRVSPARREAGQLLGVDPAADRDTIKRAFRQLARLRHPDMHPSASHERRRALETEFARLTSAYKALTGPRGRNLE